MTEKTVNKDCLSCRLTSGFGLIACAAYVYVQSKRQSKVQSYVMKSIAAGVGGIGIARLLNMDFLKTKSKES